jgi:hypothetical protein
MPSAAPNGSFAFAEMPELDNDNKVVGTIA